MLRDESDGLLSICRKPDPALPEFARIESVASTVMELARGVMHDVMNIGRQRHTFAGAQRRLCDVDAVTREYRADGGV